MAEPSYFLYMSPPWCKHKWAEIHGRTESGHTWKVHATDLGYGDDEAVLSLLQEIIDKLNALSDLQNDLENKIYNAE